MTADDRRFAPPHELVGPLGQVIDPGGGFVPGLAPAPLPGALATTTPGLALAALAPAGAPTISIDEPSKLALAIERLAGELLGGPPGSSLAPVPLAPGAWNASHVQLPASPGIGPGFAPPPAALPSGLDEPSKLALALERLAGEPVASPQAGAAGAPPPPPVGGMSSVAWLPAGGMTTVPLKPVASGFPQGPDAAAAAPALSTATPGLAAPSVTSSPFAAQPSFGAWNIGLPAPGVTSSLFAAQPSFGASNAGLPAPGVTSSPFAAEPSFGAWGFGLPPVPLISPADSTAGAPPADRTRFEAAPAQPTVVRQLGGVAFDPYTIRKDFPILDERVHGGKRLVWLDNAATTQKPRAVIDRLSYFYEHENSNIHRAAHVLAARATDAYEAGRESVRRFVNAPSTSEIVFVRGATEGINLVAQSWGRRNVAAGDEIVITHLEHHANIVPWQQLCAAAGARLRIAPVDDRGDIIVEDYERLLGPRTRLVALPQVSNALGTVTPARAMIEIAHRHGAVVLLDGAQAVSHMRVDVQELDCDFYVFSGHKVFAPTGIGAVFGKRALLDAMPPWQGGGNMIQDVTFERTTYQPPPFRFEAGTGNIADAVGLGAALDYVTRIGIDNIDRYEHELLRYAEHQLATVPGLAMIGTPREKAGVLSFVLDGKRTEDVGGALDKEGIAVRSGHHCAQPILRRFGLESTVRASLAFYNICEDIDALVDALRRLQGGRPA